MNRLMGAVKTATFRAGRYAASVRRRLAEDESGVSNFVATVVLILIVVLLCAVLYQALGDWFVDMWDRITNAI